MQKPPATRRLRGHVWLTDCPTCGRTRAQTDPHGYPRQPRNQHNTPIQGSYCARCGTELPTDARKGRVYEAIGREPHPCDQACLRAEGDDCLCACLGDCHGRGECGGHQEAI